MGSAPLMSGQRTQLQPIIHMSRVYKCPLRNAPCV